MTVPWIPGDEIANRGNVVVMLAQSDVLKIEIPLGEAVIKFLS